MATIPSKPPVRRSVNWRSLVLAAVGPTPKYPTYQFSRRTFLEKPTHNPFKGL